MKNSQATNLWVLTALLNGIICMTMCPGEARGCGPSPGPCYYWDGDSWEVIPGSTCTEDSNCGECGTCSGWPCTCSANADGCPAQCDECDTEGSAPFDCYDDDAQCDGYDCYDCVAGSCISRCGSDGNPPICDAANDQCVECMDEYDCYEGYECVEGECKQPCTYDYECGACEECGDDGYCAYICLPTEVCVNGTCAAEGVCNPECSEEEICVNGECVPNTGGGECDPECQPDEICANGECVPEGTGCSPQCGANEDCVNGDCIPSPGPGPCQPPCEPDEICVNSTCVPDTGGCDPECGPDEMCVNETCVPDGSGCDPSCPPGMSCVGEICVPDGSGCDPLCAPGYTCTNGVCVPDGGDCDPECQPGQSCVNGGCMTPPPQPCPECKVRNSSGQCVDNDGAPCGDMIHYTCQGGSCNCTADDEWGVGDPIIAPTIDEPEEDAIVAPGATVVLRCSGASDADHHGYCQDNDWHDEYPGDSLTFTWTATAGTFTDDEGSEATWIAPCGGGEVTITVTADDAGEHGYDDDGSASATVTVEVRTVSIQAVEISDGLTAQLWNVPLRDTDDLKFDILLDGGIAKVECVPVGSIFVSTSKCAEVQVPINETNATLLDGGTKVRVTIPNAEARMYGLIVDPIFSASDAFSYDVVPTGNFNDSDRFDFFQAPTCVLGRALGNWTEEAWEFEIGGVTIPPWSASTFNSPDFLKAGGAVFLDVRAGGESDRGMIQYQADYIYLSGHGLHSTGEFNGVAPESLDWSAKEIVIIAGCSVLDIDDLNNNFSGPDHLLSPGRRWAALPAKYLLGYNYFAPADDHVDDPYFTAGIVSGYFMLKDYYGAPVTAAWGYANRDMAGGPLDSPYNSCAIDTENGAYWYWDKLVLLRSWEVYLY